MLTAIQCARLIQATKAAFKTCCQLLTCNGLPRIPCVTSSARADRSEIMQQGELMISSWDHFEA
jgi:hypothetical protein